MSVRMWVAVLAGILASAAVIVGLGLLSGWRSVNLSAALPVLVIPPVLASLWSRSGQKE